jgi:hypothetical protein
MAKTGGKRAKGLSQPASGPEIQWKDARWLSLAQPLAVIRLAMREVPAVKYALGVAGVVAVIAVIAALRIDLRVAAFGVPVLFIFMVVLVVFAHVAITSPDYFRLPAIIFIWVSLLLVIGVGVLLFSSVFFRTPVDLQEFLRGRRVDEPVKMQVISIPRETETRVSPATAPASQAAAWAALAGRPLDLVKDATAQQEKQEYKRAWDLLTKAGKLQPQHPVIVDAQVKLAMDWLRNCTVVVGEETFVKIVDQVTPVLEARAASDAPDAADAMAHIAWGKVLKSYEEPPAPDIDDEFGRVLKRDGNNPYAHAMLAVWIVTMNGAPEQAQRHIDRALSTGLARPVVRQFQMMVLQLGLLRDEPGIIPRVIRTWNEMRLNHESFPRAAPNSPCERAAMVHDVYFTPSGTEAIQKELNSILSPEDHLDTFKWLIQGWDMDHPPQRFWMGRLTEARSITRKR